MLGEGQDFVGHHRKTSVLAGLTSLCLQYVQVNLFWGLFSFLLVPFAAGFVALRTPAAVGFTFETHKTICFPFHFEEPRFALIIGGIPWGVMAEKP